MTDAVRIYIEFLNHDVSVFFLPAAYFRYVMAPPEERRSLTIAAAFAVGALALNLFGSESGSWCRLRAVLAALAASVSVLQPGRWRLVGSLLGAAAVAWATARDESGFVAAVAAALVAALPSLVALVTTQRRASSVLVILLAGGTSFRTSIARSAYAATSTLLPLEEFALTHATAQRFVGVAFLETHASTLVLTTIHVQISCDTDGDRARDSR